MSAKRKERPRSRPSAAHPAACSAKPRGRPRAGDMQNPGSQLRHGGGFLLASFYTNQKGGTLKKDRLEFWYTFPSRLESCSESAVQAETFRKEPGSTKGGSDQHPAAPVAPVQNPECFPKSSGWGACWVVEMHFHLWHQSSKPPLPEDCD